MTTENARGANFADALKDTLDDEKSVTENGAVGYASAGSELLTMNFTLSSLRNETEQEIAKRYARVYFENPKLAVAFLFFAGDVRGGCGERRTFRACFDWLVRNEPAIASRLAGLIPEYSRWDNLVRLVDSAISETVVGIVKKQLLADASALKCNGRVSLLAKWMPSERTSSKATRRLAKSWISRIGWSPRDYRKTLSALRAKISVVETFMSSDRFSEIDYGAVPSRANLKYAKAFVRHDKERREKYLEDIKKGKAKINASEAVFPHEIVSRLRRNTDFGEYNGAWDSALDGSVDATLESMWNALPNKVGESDGGTICVVDSSASMDTRAGCNSSVTCWEVALSLGIYTSERLHGQFHDKFITFSKQPRFIDMENCKTLRQKVTLAEATHIVENTDIEAVFDLILHTAVDHGMKQKDLPGTVLVLSDMEFDDATTYGFMFSPKREAKMKTLFETIADKYREAGYWMPRMVFWNISSRTGTVPVRSNENGVALVSGFSTNIMDMVMSSEIDPYKVLVKTITSERYQPVIDAFERDDEADLG